jgi:hypothetical protein
MAASARVNLGRIAVLRERSIQDVHGRFDRQNASQSTLLQRNLPGTVSVVGAGCALNFVRQSSRTG